MEGPASPQVRAGPPKDGAAAYSYNTSTPGAYTISATVHGAHVRGSPATVVASIAEPHAPLCVVKGAARELSMMAGTRLVHRISGKVVGIPGMCLSMRLHILPRLSGKQQQKQRQAKLHAPLLCFVKGAARMVSMVAGACSPQEFLGSH